MKRKKLLYLFIVVITLSSCSIEIHKNTSVYFQLNCPIQADVEVDKSKTLQGTSVTTVYFGIFKTGDLKETFLL